MIVDPVPVAELNPIISAKLSSSTELSKICDPSKYHLNSIVPSFTPSAGSGNDAVAIPVNVAIETTFD